MAVARNSVIEAYRILAMFAIVAHHYGVHGGVLKGTGGDNVQNFLLGYSSMGKWGVDVFVLIGAYFMAQSTFRWRGMRAVLIQVWTTSWIILIVALIWLPGGVSTRTVWRAIAPVSTNYYWFVTVFVMLMILSPFINILVKAMTRRQHLTLVGVLFVAWSLLSLVPEVSFGVSNLAWFVELYLIAAFIARYPLSGTARGWGAAAIGFAVAVPLTTILAGAAARAVPVLEITPGLIRAQESPLVVLAAVCGLVAATKMRPRVSPAINLVASAAFGVYLIHDNPIIRPLLWKDWVGTVEAVQSPWLLPLHALLWSLAIYAAATLIELGRQRLVQRPLMKVGDRLFSPRTSSR
ncbi:acyltransferase family protein [Demequina aurantiaca]|uniref:acyltransferase family protein n=1 Tax=Demequina aurantiaca TaxID=676200 RepID=UPI003D33B6BE